MAIIQSEHALGRKQAPYAAESNNVVVAKYEVTLNSNIGATDVVELGILPAYSVVVDATLVTDAMGTGITADVGIMSGTPGAPDDSRTVGNELYAAADVAAAAVTRLSKADAFRLAPTESDRALGLKVSGAVTASGQKATLVIQYAALSY